MLKLLPILVLVVAAQAHATVTIKMKQEHYGEQTKTCDLVFVIEPSRGRVDSDCGPQKVAIITLKDAHKMVMINEGSKTYVEMDMALIEKLQTDPMEALKSDPRFAAQLEKMTAEQRASMQKMMTEAMKRAKDAKAELKKIGKQKKVGTWNCTTYGVYVNGKLSEDLCLADPGQFPDLKPVMASWAEFNSGWLKLSRSPTLKAHEAAAKIGVSVETILFDNGKMKSKTNIAEIKTESRPDAFFKAPADFTKSTSVTGH